jgi:hypothetical protein
MLKTIATVNIHEFMTYVLGKAKFLRVMANILLDSDSLCLEGVISNKNDKLMIVRKAFELVEFLTSDEMAD